MSDQTIDSSNNVIEHLLSHNFFNFMNELGGPGDTFTIESTFINAPIPSSMDRVGSEENAEANNSDNEEEETDDEMPELEDTPIVNNYIAEGPTTSNEIPIQNLYSQVSRLFGGPVDSSGNDIFASTRYASSAPTTRRDYSRTFRFPRNRRMAISSMENDVNSDYESFLSSLFTRARPRQNINNILQTSLLDPSQNLYKHVLSEEGEEEIKKLKYEADKFPEQKSCPMTLSEFKEGAEIAQLPCGHIFEYDAILKWLQDENACCPVCRKKMGSKEVKKELKIRHHPRPIQNRRMTTQDLVTHLIHTRMRHDEDEALQAAIMASLREGSNNNNTDDTPPSSD